MIFPSLPFSFSEVEISFGLFEEVLKNSIVWNRIQTTKVGFAQGCQILKKQTKLAMFVSQIFKSNIYLSMLTVTLKLVFCSTLYKPMPQQHCFCITTRSIKKGQIATLVLKSPGEEGEEKTSLMTECGKMQLNKMRLNSES
jgi:hypothetical protein